MGIIAWLFSDARNRSRTRTVGIYALLIEANVIGWIWALAVVHGHPALLGTAFFAYTFGLRHAFDADHIVAIDNVTRKLIQQGKRPAAAGLFFSLGHSTVVAGLCAAIALATAANSISLRLSAAWLGRWYRPSSSLLSRVPTLSC
jgi:nickel/cobalt transporter (NiCoT) family protein